MIWEIHYFITKPKTKIDVIPRGCFNNFHSVLPRPPIGIYHRPTVGLSICKIDPYLSYMSVVYDTHLGGTYDPLAARGAYNSDCSTRHRHDPPPLVTQTIGVHLTPCRVLPQATESGTNVTANVLSDMFVTRDINNTFT